jgi:hypothetical protein
MSRGAAEAVERLERDADAPIAAKPVLSAINRPAHVSARLDSASRDGAARWAAARRVIFAAATCVRLVFGFVML